MIPVTWVLAVALPVNTFDGALVRAGVEHLRPFLRAILLLHSAMNLDALLRFWHLSPPDFSRRGLPHGLATDSGRA